MTKTERGFPMDDMTNNMNSSTEGKETVAAKPEKKGLFIVGFAIALIGIAVSVAASFQTLFHLGIIAKMTAMEGDFRIGSLVTFAILAVVLVTVLIHDGGVKGYCFIGGLAVLGEAVIHYLYVTQRLSRINILWINLGDAVKMDVGFYLMLGGGILLMLGGLFMPPVTKKAGVITMAIVVILLIAAGVAATFLLNSSGGSKSKKDETTAKKDDASFILDLIFKAEMVAVDPYIDAVSGTTFTISLNGGNVSLSSSSWEAARAWEEEVEKLSHELKLDSSGFSTINGSITGTLQNTGSVVWTGTGVSALTNYSSTLARYIK